MTEQSNTVDPASAGAAIIADVHEHLDQAVDALKGGAHAFLDFAFDELVAFLDVVKAHGGAGEQWAAQVSQAAQNVASDVRSVVDQVDTAALATSDQFFAHVGSLIQAISAFHDFDRTGLATADFDKAICAQLGNIEHAIGSLAANAGSQR